MMLVRTLGRGLCALALAVTVTAEAKPLEIVSIGDSATQGVWADTEVGRSGPLFQASLADAFGKLEFYERLGIGLSSITDPAERAKYFSKMFTFVRRPGLSVFIGNEPYSLPKRLAKATGREVRLIGRPLLAGNYGEAWVQLDEIRAGYAKDPSLSGPELVFVNFNGIDFNRKTPLPQFQEEVRSFYESLAQTFPQATIVVTEIFDAVSLITEPDQFAFSFQGMDVTCGQLYQRFQFGTLHGLAPGVTGEVRDRAAAYQAAMNQIIIDEIAVLNSREGAYADFVGRGLLVDGFAPPSGLYRPFAAADCLHPNRDGLRLTSQVIWGKLWTTGVVKALTK